MGLWALTAAAPIAQAANPIIDKLMAFQELLEHACKRPQMYGKTFLDVAQFINGYDAGYTAAIKQIDPDAEHQMAFLSRFRQWLATKMGGSQSRFWETIVAEAFPDDETRFQQTVLLFHEFKSQGQ